jgi:hypothetical protein
MQAFPFKWLDSTAQQSSSRLEARVSNVQPAFWLDLTTRC